MGDNAIQKVLVVHGYTASPSQNWFPWLAEGLEKSEETKVFVPAMPNPHQPEASAWLNTLRQTMPQVDENTHFVGHSLGCIAILLFLRDLHPGQRIGSLTMVSGFGTTTTTLPELSNFTEPKPDLAFVSELTSNRCVITSRNDEIVPWAYSRDLASEIDAPLFNLKTGGHFLDRDGYTEFPFLLKIIESFL